MNVRGEEKLQSQDEKNLACDTCNDWVSFVRESICMHIWTKIQDREEGDIKMDGIKVGVAEIKRWSEYSIGIGIIRGGVCPNVFLPLQNEP